MLVISHKDNKGGKDEKGIELEKKLFITHPSFNIVAFIILLLLTGIYTLLW
jgi:SSS family solute:Na+ symporter